MSTDLRDELADYFTALLRVSRGQLSTSANVLDLGADSIMLLEARSWMEARYGLRIEIRRFFEDLDTIDAIAAFLAEARTSAPASDRVATERSAGPDAPGASLADLGLMRSQLALVAEVIETQNRVAASLRRRRETPLAALAEARAPDGPGRAATARMMEGGIA